MTAPLLKLNNGLTMPQLGFGTFQLQGQECRSGVMKALVSGYRHIDTAVNYKNQEYVGAALNEYIKAGKAPREEIFVTTKLWVTDHHPRRVAECLDECLEKLQLDYVDLFLMHMPISFKDTGKLRSMFPCDGDNNFAFSSVPIVDTWKAMEDCVGKGKARSIGVCNFSTAQIDRILAGATVKPVTVQVECHLYLQQFKMAKYCREKNILLTAFNTLGTVAIPKPEGEEDDVGKVLDNPVAKAIADKHEKTVAQVLLRFLVQNDKVVIAVTPKRERIIENIDVFDFELSADEMAQLVKENKNHRYLDFFTPERIFKFNREYPWGE